MASRLAALSARQAELYDHSVRVPLVIGGPGLPIAAKC